MAKRAVIRISVERIAQLLGLPDGVEILHVAPSAYSMAFDLVVTASDMADTDTDILAEPPRLIPLYEYNGDTLRIAHIDYPRSGGDAVANP